MERPGLRQCHRAAQQPGRDRPAEQQDPREHHERIDLRSRQPRIAGVRAESERGHREHDQAEQQARAGADGQRGRGHRRPPRGHPEEDDDVAGRQDQEEDLARPGGTAGRRARHPVGTVSAGDKDAQVKTPLRHGKRVRPDDGPGRYQGQDRRVPADAQEPGGPAVADRSDEPAGQQRQPGQQQHGRDHPEPVRGGMKDRRVRPGGPGRHGRGHREQRRADNPAGHQRLPREHPHPAGAPGQPLQPRWHVVGFGPDRHDPVPPPGGQQPRHGPAGRGHRPLQPAHDLTPPQRTPACS